MPEEKTKQNKQTPGQESNFLRHCLEFYWQQGSAFHMLGPGLTARCLFASGTPTSCPDSPEKPQWGPDPSPASPTTNPGRTGTVPRGKQPSKTFTLGFGLEPREVRPALAVPGSRRMRPHHGEHQGQPAPDPGPFVPRRGPGSTGTAVPCGAGTRHRTLYLLTLLSPSSRTHWELPSPLNPQNPFMWDTSDYFHPKTP